MYFRAILVTFFENSSYWLAILSILFPTANLPIHLTHPSTYHNLPTKLPTYLFLLKVHSSDARIAWKIAGAMLFLSPVDAAVGTI